MEKIKTIVASVSLVMVGLLWLLTSPAEAATIRLTCSAKDTIGNAIKKLKPGDTLLVTGSCNEHVEIPAEVARITLDGQDKATINGPDATKDTMTIRGRAILMKGFTITGGGNAIQVEVGGDAVIDGNTVNNAGRFGIGVNRMAFAVIVNNTIRNNTSQGIAVAGGAFAFIGFRTGIDKTTSPNTIENNGDHGITVARSSSARIVGNMIRNNKRNAVNVSRASQADISNNTIEGNGGDGINVTQNSSVSLGIGTGTGIFDLPNSTASPNGGVGTRCALNSSVDGRLGSLNGNSATKDFDPSCTESLQAVVLGKQP